MKKITLIAFLFAFIGFQSNAQLKSDNYSLLDENDLSSFLILADNSDFNTSSFEFDGNEDQKKRRKKRKKKSRRSKKGSSGSGLMVGVKAGGNLANISGDLEGDEIKHLFGFAGGAFAQYQLSDMLGIVAELNFEQKGYKMEYSMEIFGISTEYKDAVYLNYITIPVMGRVMFGDAVKIYANAGPYFGIFAGGKYKSEVTMDGDTQSDEAKIKDGIKPLDIGLVGGAGAIIPVSDAFQVFVDARYTMGFTSTDDSELELDIKNNTIGFNVGAIIPLQ